MQSVVILFNGCVPVNPEVAINGKPLELEATSGNPRRFTASTPPIKIIDAKLTATSVNVRGQCNVRRTTAEFVNGACQATFVVACEPLWSLDITHPSRVDFSFYVASGKLGRSCGIPPATTGQARITDTTIGRIGGGDTVVLIVPDKKGEPVKYEFTRQQLQDFNDNATLHEIGAASASGNPNPGTTGRAVSKALAQKTPNMRIKAATVAAEGATR